MRYQAARVRGISGRSSRAVLAMCCLLLIAVASAADDDDVARAAPNGLPSLNAEQQRAVGIAVARPVPAQAPERIDALGEVLDPSALIADLGESTSASAAERAAAAEASRLRALHQGGAGASLKMLEAADAEQARAHALSGAATARFNQRWGPIAELPAAEREKLIERSAGGHALLLRADLPGRRSLGAVPERALLEVDGVQVSGRVLGPLRQSSEVQSTGLLIEVPRAPTGLGVGARIPVTLMSARQKGVALPRDALLYDENGAYVYKQLRADKGADPTLTRYAPVKVKLLVRYGNGWLVEGVDDDDDVVVRGAGVLWSLQGMGSQPVGGDED